MPDPTTEPVISFTVPAGAVPERADKYCLQFLPRVTRSQLKRWFDMGRVSRKGVPLKPAQKLQPGDEISVMPLGELPTEIEGEDLDLDILFEDDFLLVLNKPAGLVVHPAAGHRQGTLANALVHHLGKNAAAFRGGLVHRLDKDTSGVMIVAKSVWMQKQLQELFQARNVYKEYLGVVWGAPRTRKGSLQNPISRHPTDRKRFSSKTMKGRAAHTDYEIIKTAGPVSVVKFVLHTGRTHQIRVHMTDLGHPLLGDKTYGRRRGPIKAWEWLLEFPRQALHARILKLTHPETGDEMTWEAPLPKDLQTLLNRI